MYNWSVDEEKAKKANPEAYRIWRLEQMINLGLGDDKLDRSMLKKYWDKLLIDKPTRDYLAFLLWQKKKKTRS
ncbi:hypothetical protein HY504_03030 [Candidatus Wolfebacteria bacterium]|nr:hypothetical protein [Candidatus Wolfebacteria bacterium]